jgi:hypothetical protein
MAGARSILDERRERLRDPAVPANGIESIEVDPVDRTRLTVRFVKSLPGEPGGVPATAPLGRTNVTIAGGDRFAAIGVAEVASNGRDLTVVTDRVGDFAPYTLSLVDVTGFDPILSTITFGFRADCATDFDCARPELPSITPVPAPRIDYLAKDYDGFRQVMLDRMASLAPDWRDRHVADTGTALVELAAYVADDLSYRQDAVATEAYLGTARRRTSARRHARLLGYRINDGTNARTPVQVNLAATLAADSDVHVAREDLTFLTHSQVLNTPSVEAGEVAKAVDAGSLVFEPMHGARLRRSHEVIPFHDWGDERATLRIGATEAYLRDVGNITDLQTGDFLVIAQRRDADTGRLADADRRLRQLVRITAPVARLTDPLEPDEDGTPLTILRVRWHPDDALRFDLHIGRRPVGDSSGDSGPSAVAWGNLVLADHGWSMATSGVSEVLPMVPADVDPMESTTPQVLAQLDRVQRYRPTLRQPYVTIAAVPFDPAAVASDLTGVQRPLSAVAALTVRSEGATPAIRLRDGDGLPWNPVPDLITSRGNAHEFVAEIDRQGLASLRFGDDINGKQPNAQDPEDLTDRFVADYRVGGGAAGNVGAEAIAHVVRLGSVDAVSGARNPIPAVGGRQPETVAEVRQRAPVSFRQQKRAVTAQDYQELVTARSDVQRARVRSLWTGSCKTFFIAVDRVGGREVDPPFQNAILNYLEPFRTMGHDLAVEPPHLVPLELALTICVAPDHFRSDVEAALLVVFSSGYDNDGRPGFFHPDRLSFGDPIFLSRIYKTALSVDGVEDVIVTRFRRWRTPGESGLDRGVLHFGASEIPVLDNDPNYPGRGALTIVTEGGR